MEDGKVALPTPRLTEQGRLSTQLGHHHNNNHPASQPRTREVCFAASASQTEMWPQLEHRWVWRHLVAVPAAPPSSPLLPPAEASPSIIEPTLLKRGNEERRGLAPGAGRRIRKNGDETLRPSVRSHRRSPKNQPRETCAHSSDQANVPSKHRHFQTRTRSPIPTPTPNAIAHLLAAWDDRGGALVKVPAGNDGWVTIACLPTAVVRLLVCRSRFNPPPAPALLPVVDEKVADFVARRCIHSRRRVRVHNVCASQHSLAQGGTGRARVGGRLAVKNKMQRMWCEQTQTGFFSR